MAPPLHQPTAPSQDLLKQWLQRHLDLLQAERDEEQRQSKLLLSKTPPKVLEHNGLALLGLGAASVRIGLGAKLLVELERPSAFHSSALFPAHTFRPGDLAEIQDHNVSTVAESGPSKGSASKSSSKGKSEGIQGVVYRVSDNRIVIAVSDRKKGGKAKGASVTAPASSATPGDDKSDKRDARTGDSTKVSGDELEIPERVRLVKVANEATFDRMERTLTRLAKMLGVNVRLSGRATGDSDSDSDNDDAADPTTVSAPSSAGATRLVRALVGLDQPAFASPQPELPLPPFNDRLNPSQLEAIRFALAAKDVALIHGPPGTGKTTAIVELIMQLVAGNVVPLPSAGSGGGVQNGAGSARGPRVLVCGASNLAVDNLLERIVGRAEHREALKKRGAGVTRLGHPARVLSSLHGSTLDAQSSTSSEGQLVADVASELSSALASLRPPSAESGTAGNKSTRTSSKRLKGSERRQRWEEVRLLRREYRQRERGVTRSILDRAQIVVATCHGAGAKQLAGREFDVVVIDEACQALEAACWIPILKLREGGKVILAGDHLQLPPTVKSLKKEDARKSKVAGGKKDSAKTKKKQAAASDAKATSGSDGGKAETEIKTEDVDGEDEEEDEATATFASPPGRSGTVATQLRPPRSLETTLFSRLLGLYGPGLKALLSIQYRMNASIMSFPNQALYESRLEAHDSCRDICLGNLANFVSASSGDGGGDEEEGDDVETAQVVFYDTAGCEMFESMQDEGEGSTAVGQGSKTNANEAELVRRHIGLLVARGLEPEQITVLSPYSAQVSLLSSLLRSCTFPSPAAAASGGGGGNKSGEAIEVGTIDGMQGREKDVVILSLVRSNERGEVGFLDEKRRLNVAMTRAKRQLVVIADSETVAKGGPYLRQWIKWLDENALVESAVTIEMCA